MVFMQGLCLTTQCNFSGGVPILVAALDSPEAPAVKAIDMLLSQSNLPSKHIEAIETVLVNLQAVPRLCKLLPPAIPGWTGDEDKVQGKSPCFHALSCPALLCTALPCPACPALPCSALPWSPCFSQVSIFYNRIAHCAATNQGIELQTLRSCTGIRGLVRTSLVVFARLPISSTGC